MKDKKTLWSVKFQPNEYENEIIQKEKKELEDTQARIRHQSNEEKLK